MQEASEAELEVVARWLRQTLMGSKAVRDVMSKKVEAPVAKKPAAPMAMYLGSDSDDDDEEDEEPRVSKKRKATTAHAASKRRRAPSYEESSEESSDEPSEEPSDEPSDESGMETESGDEWDEYCKVCGKGGELICCDGCPASFHLRCAHLRVGAGREVKA